jgi:tRNA threonylcarbamoyladenosine biosynthesis protein TsaB
MLLALDTSTSYASIALAHDGRAVAELTWEVGKRHSTELFDKLSWLLAAYHTAPSALDGVAVALGPGSFNGVRVAVATAKALAFALDLPLYGHATLDIIAWGMAHARVPVWALLEAGRGQLFAAPYDTSHATADEWKPTEQYAILTPSELALRIVGPVLCAGEWRPETQATLEEALGERADFASTLPPRRASWLADLALQRHARGMRDDPAALEPLYLRRPNITTSAKVALPQIDEERAGRPREMLGGEGVSRVL